jgi:hypothetical protein
LAIARPAFCTFIAASWSCAQHAGSSKSVKPFWLSSTQLPQISTGGGRLVLVDEVVTVLELLEEELEVDVDDVLDDVLVVVVLVVVVVVLVLSLVLVVMVVEVLVSEVEVDVDEVLVLLTVVLESVVLVVEVVLTISVVLVTSVVLVVSVVLVSTVLVLDVEVTVVVVVPEPDSSKAPTSQWPPTGCGRGVPRWSVPLQAPLPLLGAAGLPASMARLPGRRAWVSVGPPLLASGPSRGSIGAEGVPTWSPPMPSVTPPHASSSPTRL